MSIYRQLIFGFIFDIDSAHYLNGVKGEVINFSRSMDADDRLYVFQEGIIDIPRWRGPATAVISNYKQHYFDKNYALKQTLVVIGSEDYDAVKHLFLISDNYSSEDEYGYKRGLALDSKTDFNCHFHFCGIGKKYDGNIKDLTSFHHHAFFHHLETPQDLSPIFSDIKKEVEDVTRGEEDIYSESNEGE